MSKRDHKLIRKSLVISMAVICPLAFAAEKNEAHPDYYGQGQADRFRRAVAGISEPLSPTEEAEVASVQPFVESGRFYIRANAFLSKQRLRKISLVSSTGGLANATINTKKTSENKNSIAFAIGYNFENLRIDLEYISAGKLNMSTTITPAVGAAEVLTSTVTANPILLNVGYDYTGLRFINPYVFIGGGISQNTAKLNIAGRGETSSRKFTPAVSVGLGARFKVWGHLHGDVNYRFTSLGSVKWRDDDTALATEVKIKGKRWLTGPSVGLIWFF